ncbi:hypothetical protein M0805_006087 [Coniferiporia weirii]|nr:hypothetical protein M0805_006087 [Coniferiporia weirii]
MAKGSQLTQLKSALTQAGLNGKPPSGKKRKHTAPPREANKDKNDQKLLEIQQKLNPFDVKVTRLKHDVGGRRLKGVTGRPQESKQAGIEQRKRTLLKEYEAKNHAGGIIDRRFGENDPTMTPEERMLERFTKERQRAPRGAVFNLEDEDELTHYGQSLSKMDDFDDAGLGTGVNDDSDSDGKIDAQIVKQAHFGGFDDEDSDEDGGEEGQPPRKKSKAEVMTEVIAKSKQHKYERQLQKKQDENTRHQLDNELDDIRGLLFAGGRADVVSAKLMSDDREEDRDYDQHVRELALDKRAQPKDRTKTEDELAFEAKEALEKAERRRQRRMMGDPDESSSDERGKKRKKVRGDTGGDDLDDDFLDDEDAEWNEIGTGLEGEDASSAEGSGDEQGTEREEAEEDEDEDSGTGSSASSEGEASDSEAEIMSSKVSGYKANSKGKGKASKPVLPFTFPCPESHEEFLNIVKDVDEKDIPIVIERIRALYHPSLGKDNKYKLQALTGVLIDYILHITSPPSPLFELFPPLLSHVRDLTKAYPTESAGHFISKMKLMQKNLNRGLSKDATSLNAKTWPGTSELALLWSISHIWPTSDLNHPVVSPARLLMGSYLGLCRVRTLHDLLSGLFLCTLFLRFEEHSRRLIPEATNFILNAILCLAPHRFKYVDSLPGAFPCPDFGNALCQSLQLNRKLAKALIPRPPNLARIMEAGSDSVEQAKIDLLATSFGLLGQYADMYKSLDGFIELFDPAAAILDGVSLGWASEVLKTKHVDTAAMVGRLLKFARQSRRPLTLQAHKPIPIATYIPKFENSSSGYLRKNDPDHERAAASKLRYQYKQERRGAIRELRKDARFMSAVKQKEQQEKDRSYADKMNKVFSTLESERAEQKKMDREKDKEQKRSGRK